MQRSLEPVGWKGDDLEETKLVNLLNSDQVDTRPCMLLHGHVECS